MKQSNLGYKKSYKHVYETPAVYSAIYGRQHGYKMGEAQAYAHILEKSRPASASKKMTVLELLAGDTSKHRDYFMSLYSFSSQIDKYLSMDGIANGDFDIIRDPLGHKFDVALAYFYSANCIVDMKNGGRVTREGTVRALKNVFDHLKPGGLFILDSVSDGYSVSTCLDSSVTGEILKTAHYVDYGSELGIDLRKRGLKFDPQDRVELHARTRSYYDHASSNSIDDLQSVTCFLNDKPVFKVGYTVPFCIRYFSEPELLDMAREAGFTACDLWFCEYSNADFKQLEPTLMFPSEIDENDDETRDTFLPNTFVFYKNPRTTRSRRLICL